MLHKQYEQQILTNQHLRIKKKNVFKDTVQPSLNNFRTEASLAQFPEPWCGSSSESCERLPLRFKNRSILYFQQKLGVPQSKSSWKKWKSLHFIGTLWAVMKPAGVGPWKSGYPNYHNTSRDSPPKISGKSVKRGSGLTFGVQSKKTPSQLKVCVYMPLFSLTQNLQNSHNPCSAVSLEFYCLTCSRSTPKW